jgi:hypothetical protein
MLDEARRIWNQDRPTLLREAAGLFGLAVAIVAALYLPILA